MTKKAQVKFIPRMRDVIGMTVLSATGIYMACISWQRWADISIDFGVELYVPWQLAKGKILYLDIWQLYGPFSQYFNSMIFRVFGVSLMNLALFNILLIVVMGYVLYRIFLELADNVTAITIVAFFLSVFAFSQYVGCANYNYVCPYSHELTHGILFSFVSIYFFMKYVNKRSPALLFLIGILTGAVLLTKAEVFFALFCAIAAGLVCLMVIDRLRIAEIIKIAAIYVIGLLLPTIFFLIYFSRYMQPLSALSTMMLQYNILSERTMTSQKFIMWVLGFDNPVYNLKMLLMAAEVYIGVFILYGVSSFLPNRIKTNSLKKIAMALIILALIMSAPFIIKNINWLEIGRPLPVFTLLFGIYVFIKMASSARTPQKMKSLLPLFVLSILSFTILFKMILNSHLFHYGFVLAMPATLLLVMTLLYQIPDFFGRLFGNKYFIRLVGLILVAIIMAAHIGLTKNIYDKKTFLFSSGADAMKTWDPRLLPQGECGRRALEQIEKIIGKNETFVAFPEGVLYNYLSRRDNPTPYYDFKPVPVGIWGKQYLRALTGNPPDYVLLIERNTSDCGPRYFGHDYAFDIYSWIKDNYKIIYQIGYPLSGAGYGVAIAKRTGHAV